jgi:hypothetical protein
MTHSVEILDIRYRGCFKTGAGAIGASYRETKQLFKKAQSLAVKEARAAFIVDLHDHHGNLVDTALIDRRGYEALTGETAPTYKESREYDAQYWANARAVVRNRKAT